MSGLRISPCVLTFNSLVIALTLGNLLVLCIIRELLELHVHLPVIFSNSYSLVTFNLLLCMSVLVCSSTFDRADQCHLFPLAICGSNLVD